MTYESDQQLAALNARRLEDLPQQAGFSFVGVQRDGGTVDCYLRHNRKTGKCDVNFYYAETSNLKDQSEALIGWRYAPGIAA